MEHLIITRMDGWVQLRLNRPAAIRGGAKPLVDRTEGVRAISDKRTPEVRGT